MSKASPYSVCVDGFIRKFSDGLGNLPSKTSKKESSQLDERDCRFYSSIIILEKLLVSSFASMPQANP